MSQEIPSSAVLSTSRLLLASPGQVFSAFEQPELLARWWGPQGFTNTFQQFDFQPDGRWVFVMHGPNGADYPNESVFQEIVPNEKLVIEHVVAPWYKLTVRLKPESETTLLTWDQEFESSQFAAKMRTLSETANEQVLDRLQVLLAEKNP